MSFAVGVTATGAGASGLVQEAKVRKRRLATTENAYFDMMQPVDDDV